MQQSTTQKTSAPQLTSIDVFAPLVYLGNALANKDINPTTTLPPSVWDLAEKLFGQPLRKWTRFEGLTNQIDVSLIPAPETRISVSNILYTLAEELEKAILVSPRADVCVFGIDITDTTIDKMVEDLKKMYPVKIGQIKPSEQVPWKRDIFASVRSMCQRLSVNGMDFNVRLPDSFLKMVEENFGNHTYVSSGLSYNERIRLSLVLLDAISDLEKFLVPGKKLYEFDSYCLQQLGIVIQGSRVKQILEDLQKNSAEYNNTLPEITEKLREECKHSKSAPEIVIVDEERNDIRVVISYNKSSSKYFYSRYGKETWKAEHYSFDGSAGMSLAGILANVKLQAKRVQEDKMALTELFGATF